MNSFVVFTALLAAASASPLYLESAHYLPTSKATYTQASQVVNHGTTYQAAAYHAVPVVHAVAPAKSTVTSSSQVVDHGSTAVYHAPTQYYSAVPVVHTPVVHTPVVHAPVVHTPLVYQQYQPAPVVVKTGDSAVTHQSSTTHHTLPLVSSYPVYSSYH